LEGEGPSEGAENSGKNEGVRPTWGPEEEGGANLGSWHGPLGH